MISLRSPSSNGAQQDIPGSDGASLVESGKKETEQDFEQELHSIVAGCHDRMTAIQNTPKEQQEPLRRELLDLQTSMGQLAIRARGVLGETEGERFKNKVDRSLNHLGWTSNIDAHRGETRHRIVNAIEGFGEGTSQVINVGLSKTADVAASIVGNTVRFFAVGVAKSFRAIGAGIKHFQQSA